MIDFTNPKLTEYLFDGTFGLERETLRVTADAFMAHTPHPFGDDPQIVKDFCENQTEINTGVHSSADGVIRELGDLTEQLHRALDERNELLWLYSNPPYIKDGDDIPVALYEGAQRGKQSYRMYLAEKYGKYKMTLSGIHVNYSLSDELLRQGFALSSYDDPVDYKNRIYLRLAEGLITYGWVINLLLAASPVCDGSYFSPQQIGETVITPYASLRCGAEGYWNRFTPCLDYSGILAYANSIQQYINSGALAGAGELYYPVRLKPRGVNRLSSLVKNGVNHVEIRNVDINPFAPQGIDPRDLQFIELLILWLAANDTGAISEQEQPFAIQNFKNAALLDIDTATVRLPGGETCSVRKAGLRLLDAMREYFGRAEFISANAGYDLAAVLDYQTYKLTAPGARYAERVLHDFSDDYVTQMSAYMREKYSLL